MGRFSGLIIVLLLFFITGHGLQPGTVRAEEAINLGMSAAFSGPSKGLGIELYRGSMAYISQVNNEGGVYGRKINIVTADDGYNPTPAIENTIRFLDSENILLLFNYVGTPTVTRVLPIIKLYSNKDAYLFTPFTGAQPQREFPYDRFVFNLRASYRDETEGLVDHLVSIGRDRIAVFYQADAYGRSGWDGVRRALIKYGLKIKGEATYRRGTPYSQSMDRQVEIISKAKPDAIISIGAYAACAGFIRDARNAGLDIPIANLSFVGSENLLSLLQDSGQASGKDYSKDLINSQVVPSYEDLTLPAVREYRRLMDQYDPAPPKGVDSGYYHPLRYCFVSFEGYFNAKLLVHVLKQLGRNPTRSDIASVTEKIDNLDIGIDVPVRFSHTNHQGLNVVYYTTVKDGKFIPIRDWSRWKK